MISKEMRRRQNMNKPKFRAVRNSDGQRWENVLVGTTKEGNVVAYNLDSGIALVFDELYQSTGIIDVVGLGGEIYEKIYDRRDPDKTPEDNFEGNKIGDLDKPGKLLALLCEQRLKNDF
jgi:hypothetical protein